MLKPAAAMWLSEMPWPDKKRTTDTARAVDSSQLEAKRPGLTGTRSVWPSILRIQSISGGILSVVSFKTVARRARWRPSPRDSSFRTNVRTAILTPRTPHHGLARGADPWIRAVSRREGPTRRAPETIGIRESESRAPRGSTHDQHRRGLLQRLPHLRGILPDRRARHVRSHQQARLSPAEGREARSLSRVPPDSRSSQSHLSGKLANRVDIVAECGGSAGH